MASTTLISSSRRHNHTDLPRINTAVLNDTRGYVEGDSANDCYAPSMTPYSEDLADSAIAHHSRWFEEDRRFLRYRAKIIGDDREHYNERFDIYSPSTDDTLSAISISSAEATEPWKESAPPSQRCEALLGKLPKINTSMTNSEHRDPYARSPTDYNTSLWNTNHKNVWNEQMAPELLYRILFLDACREHYNDRFGISNLPTHGDTVASEGRNKPVPSLTKAWSYVKSVLRMAVTFFTRICAKTASIINPDKEEEEEVLRPAPGHIRWTDNAPLKAPGLWPPRAYGTCGTSHNGVKSPCPSITDVSCNGVERSHQFVADGSWTDDDVFYHGS